MPIVVPTLGPSGTLVYEWVDPGGIVRSLLGNPSVNVLVGERGLGIPRVDLADDKLPFASGSLIRYASIAPREIELPMLFGPVASASVLESLMDSVYGWFATADEQTQTPGYLRVTRHDGTQRQLACYYAGGLEGDLTASRTGDVWQRSEIRLKAADPWAADIANTTSAYTVAQALSFSVINQGQLTAFPVWHFHGPFGTVAATNVTTGQSWNLVVALDAARELVVDTRPSNQRTGFVAYTTDTNTNLFPYFSVPFDLWHLAPGQNDIAVVFTLTPATSSATITTLDYLARYRGLLR